MDFLRGLANGWEKREQRLIDTPWVDAVADLVAFGLSAGHVGLLEDGLRTVRPLEFNLSEVRCPVRAIHGTIDGLEPYANLERLADQVPDCAVVALAGFGQKSAADSRVIPRSPHVECRLTTVRSAAGLAFRADSMVGRSVGGSGTSGCRGLPSRR